MYHYLQLMLKERFVYPRESDAVPGNRFAEVFTRANTAGLREAVLEAFQQANSSVRIVFATIAFGMGLDIPDIQQVLHLGPSSEIEDYAQEVGRGGRNGQPCKAVIIQLSNRHASEKMKSYLKNVSQCRRVYLYTHFIGGSDVAPAQPLCACCDICSKQCRCGDCLHSVFHDSKFLYTCAD